MKKQGIYTVLAAVAIQLTLGIAYIWSVFQTGIANSIFGGDNAAAGLTFSLLLTTLTIGSVIGGKLAVKYSTRPVIFIGGIILSLGFFLASFVTANSAWLLWLTYGLMGGVGMGFTYSTTIACAQKWYPHKKGLITGIIVSALGFGGVVFTPIVEKLISVFDGSAIHVIKNELSTGVINGVQAQEAMRAIGNIGEFGEFKTFMVLSVIFLVVCSVGSLFIKNPPEGYMMDAVVSNTAAQKPTKDATSSEMFKTPQFYLLTVAFMLACMGGLMMIGFAKPIAVSKGLAATATIGVLAISMFNSIGRLLWGMISDKLGRINTIIILLSCTAVLSLLVNAATGYWIYVLIACIGFTYGGLLSNFPSLTADLFGAKHMATNYGFVLLGFGVGAVISSQIAGYYKNVAASDISLMFPAFVIASCCAIAGIIMMLILRKINK
jgi:OFA family oxalate/formate antiporter-like MFS transporter